MTWSMVGSKGNRYISSENLIPLMLRQIQQGEKSAGAKNKQPILCISTEKGDIF